jgi:hypothetical protein
MQQPPAHISQTLFEHEVFQLRQHGTRARVARVMIAISSLPGVKEAKIKKTLMNFRLR